MDGYIDGASGAAAAHTTDLERESVVVAIDVAYVDVGESVVDVDVGSIDDASRVVTIDGRV